MPEQTINCTIQSEETINVTIANESIITVEISEFVGGSTISGTILSNYILQEDLTSQVIQGKTDFTLSNSYVSGTLKILINGLKERLITELTSTTFRLSPGVDSNDSVEVEYIKQ